MVSDNINIFDYNDSNKYTKLALKKKKLSYRTLSEQCSISFTTISDIVSGKVKSYFPDKVQKIGEALGLNDFELDYFATLCELKVVKAPSTKARLEKRIKKYQHLKRQEPNSNTFLAENFLNAIIKTVASTPICLGTSQSLQKTLLKNIPLSTVKKKTQLLQEKGYIQQKGDSFLSLKEIDWISFDPNSPLSQYHQDALSYSMEILKSYTQNLPKNSHRADSLIFETTQAGVKELNLQIRSLINELAEKMANNHIRNDRVYQLNILLNPITTIEDEK